MAAVKVVSACAAAESERDGLGIRFLSVLPKRTPATAHGAAGVAGYARRDNVDVETFLKHHGPTLTTEQVGQAVLALVADAGYDKGS